MENNTSLEALVGSYSKNSDHGKIPDFHEAAQETLKHLGGKKVTDVQSLIKSYKDNSSFREDVFMLCGAVCKTLDYLGSRDVSDAEVLIKTYKDRTSFSEDSFRISGSVCETLEFLGGRSVSDAKTLINTYKDRTSFSENSSKLCGSVCSTLKSLGNRSVSDAKALIEVYSKNTSFSEDSPRFGEAVSKTLKALNNKDVSEAVKLIKNYAKDDNYRNSYRLSRKICQTLRSYEYEEQRLKEEAFAKWIENLKVEHLCYYKEDAKNFIECFSNIKNLEEQKKVLRAILNCDYENKEVVAWLDENYAELIRNVGLEP